MAKVCFDLASSVEQIEQLNLVSGGELTISSGAVTITNSVHAIDTEADAVTDDLNTISGGSVGDVILLSRASAARAVVLKHNAGNIKTPSGTDHELTALGFVILQHDGSNWHLQSGNGSGYVLNKLACLAVAVDNVTLNDEQSIDGVMCAAESRVFLAGQTDETENGPWIVKAEDPYYPSSGDWIRPNDFQNGFSVSGHAFYIEQGTVYADTMWIIRNYYGADIVGTNDLNPLNLGASDFNINTLTAESSNDNADLIAIYDDSAGAMRKQTRSEFLAGVSGGSGVADTRVITAGIGLSGGGDLSADRTLDLDVNELTAETTASDSDTIAIYDASAGAMRKQTRADFLTGISGGVADTRVITAGIGLSGGGDLSADRTINLDIDELTAEPTASDSDYVAIYDASAGAVRKQTRADFLTGITTGYVPTTRTVTAGLGLSGGGALSANITLNVAFTEFGTETVIASGDQIPFYDIDATSHKKITFANLMAGVFYADGSTGFSGQFIFSDFPGGSIEAANIAAPQITKEGYTDSGFYWGNTNNCGISVGGSKVFSWSSAEVGAYVSMRCYDDLQVDGFTKLNAIRMLAQSADPGSLLTDSGILWISDGTDTGDAGDLMYKVNAGGVTKTITLVDFSAF